VVQIGEQLTPLEAEFSGLSATNRERRADQEAKACTTEGRNKNEKTAGHHRLIGFV
jgi:hypothetical protein